MRWGIRWRGGLGVLGLVVLVLVAVGMGEGVGVQAVVWVRGKAEREERSCVVVRCGEE